MIKVLNLNPLKDIVHRGTTTHLVNIFSRMDPTAWEFYSFLSNRKFIKGSIKPLQEYGNPVRAMLYGIKKMREIHPNVLLGTGSPYELVYFIFRRRARYIIDWHGPMDKTWLLGIGNNSLRSRVTYHVAKFLLSRADRILCDSEFIHQSLVKSFPEKDISITLNGVDAEYFTPDKRDKNALAKKLKLDSSRSVAVFVGHLIVRKRPDLFALLAGELPKIQFVMIGRPGSFTGTDVQIWKRKNPNLYWFESVDEETLPQLFASADVFVFPTLEEPFGLSTVEAMASALPVVATQSGATSELVRDGIDGYLIPPGAGEIEKFIKRIEELCGNEALRREMGTAGRKKAEERFAWDGVARAYRKAILETVSKK